MTEFTCSECGHPLGRTIHTCPPKSSTTAPAPKVGVKAPASLVTPAPGQGRQICLRCGDLDAQMVDLPIPESEDADEGCAKCGGDEFAESMEEAIATLVKSNNRIEEMYFDAAGKLAGIAPAPQPIPPPLTWTKEKPKVEGLYWFRANPEAKGTVYPVRPMDGTRRLYVITYGGDLYLVDSMDATDEWAGPIPEPQAQPIPPEAGGLDTVAEYLREMAKRETPSKSTWSDLGTVSKIHWRIRAQEVIDIASRPTKKGES